jgi:dGTPase
MLAGYSVHVENSRGRRYSEAPHPYRDAFQRDRDRVVHARAFRRLEAKTQVFTRRYSDHFRNRLTHTMEVAQIARTVAQQLALNVDLVEALALVHDVGHPPFGHAGERALDAAMREYDLSFDHNLHALRIVENFEIRYAAFRGLNLTFEMREGIIKHSHDYSAAEHPELAEYLLDQRPPLEAQLIDLADEIAYDTADLDDGFEARLLTLKTIRSGLPIFEVFFQEVEALYPSAADKLKFNETLKLLLNCFVTGLIENSAAQLRNSGIETLEDVRRAEKRLIGFSGGIDHDRVLCKNFLYKHLYLSKALEPEKAEAETVIRELFSHWMRRPSDLPLSYRDQARDEPLPRVICDYIAGMTDPFILRQHGRFCISKKSSFPATSY